MELRTKLGEGENAVFSILSCAGRVRRLRTRGAGPCPLRMITDPGALFFFVHEGGVLSQNTQNANFFAFRVCFCSFLQKIHRLVISFLWKIRRKSFFILYTINEWEGFTLPVGIGNNGLGTTEDGQMQITDVKIRKKFDDDKPLKAVASVTLTGYSSCTRSSSCTRGGASLR